MKFTINNYFIFFTDLSITIYLLLEKQIIQGVEIQTSVSNFIKLRTTENHLTWLTSYRIVSRSILQQDSLKDNDIN